MPSQPPPLSPVRPSPPKTTFRRFFYRFQQDFLRSNNLWVLTAVVFGLVLAWHAVSSMSRNWELAERVSAHERDLSLLRLEVETLELENAYYASPEYQELTARRLQDKKLPGETMIVLAENSAYAKNKHKDFSTDPHTAAILSERSNPEQWLLFLFESFPRA